MLDIHHGDLKSYLLETLLNCSNCDNDRFLEVDFIIHLFICAEKIYDLHVFYNIKGI